MKRDEIIGGSIIFLCGGMSVVLSLQMPIGAFRIAGSGLFPLCLGRFGKLMMEDHESFVKLVKKIKK